MSRLARRYRQKKSKGSRHGALLANPPLLTEVAMFIGPGFGGYAVSRVASRVVANYASKLKPSLGKHIGAAASVSALVAAWFLADRWKPLAKYHTPIVVGAGIATLQTLIQTYLPGIGRFLDGPAAQPLMLPSPAATGALTNDGNEYFTYNDMFDAGVYAREAATGPMVPGSPAQQAASAEATDTLSDIMAEMGADGMDGGDNGIFSNN